MGDLRFHFGMVVDNMLHRYKASMLGVEIQRLLLSALRPLSILLVVACFIGFPAAIGLYAQDAPDPVLWAVAFLSFLSWGGLAYFAADLSLFRLKGRLKVGIGLVASLLGVVFFAKDATSSTPLGAVEAAGWAIVFFVKAGMFLLTAFTILLALALFVDSLHTAWLKSVQASQRKWETMSAHERMAFVKRYKTAPVRPSVHLPDPPP
jgi:hypothetical protein